MKLLIPEVILICWFLLRRYACSLPDEPLIKMENSRHLNDCLNVTVDSQPSTTSIWNNTPYDYSLLDVKFNYYFFNEDGTLIQSNNISSELCYDKMNCYYLFLSGHCNHYEIFSEEGNVKRGSVSYGDPFLFRIGNCKHKCGEQIQIAFFGDLGNDYITYNKREIIEEGIFTKPTMKKMCLNENGCFKVGGAVAYSMSQNESGFEEGNTFLKHKSIGSKCDSECSKKPILTESPRGQWILILLSSVSSLQSMVDPATSQYMAACWAIYDDIRRDNETILQRYILALLYFSTKGLDWKAQTSFLSPFSECNWRGLKFIPSWGAYMNNGVFCNEFGNVTEITLESNNLVGVLEDGLSKLSLLGILDVYGNKVYGTVPSKLGNLKNLQTFIVSSNNLSGSIPETILSLENMRQISLHSNNFTGTIPNLHEKYEIIWLNTNSFSGPFPVIDCKMSRLRSLKFFNNHLTGTIPDTIVNCTELNYVSLKKNRLNGTIPQNMFTLPNVEHIDLSDNSLTGTIPSKFVNGSTISHLSLARNYLTKSIPSQLSKFVNLKSLLIHDNVLSGKVPLDLTKLAKLSTLLLQNNDITGIISFDDCNQFNVVEADCGSPAKVTCECCTKCHSFFVANPCSEEGEIEISFENVRAGNPLNYRILNMEGKVVHRNENDLYVTEKDLQHNVCVALTNCFVLKFDERTSYPFHISIASDNNPFLKQNIVSSKTEVKFGYFSQNNTLQKDSCDGIRLCEQYLEVNSSKWHFVNKFTKISGVTMIQDTASNQYNSICQLLEYVDKNDEIDLIKAPLVDQFTYYALIIFYYSTNGDSWISNNSWLSHESFCFWAGISCDIYGMLETINLGSNNLVGGIPSEIGILLSLKNLKLDDNSLSGTIPVQITNLFSLKQFLMSKNDLYGSIPSEIKLFKNLLELDLSFNRLSNSLPAEIGDVRTLELLNLSNNGLNGEFPNFQDVTALKLLRLGSNLFEGRIDQLGKLLNLELLDLSRNYFIGDLPISRNQNRMTFLDVSGNEFRGRIPSDINKMQSLEEIMLYDNKLTGTLPNRITLLNDVKSISLSYNDFKGTIPSEFGKMDQLELLHLHGNTLTGTLEVSRSINSISDCGETASVPSLVQCDNCTYCCNELEVCLFRNITWPKVGGFLHKVINRRHKVANMSAADLTLIIFVLTFLFFGMFCFLLRFILNNIFKNRLTCPKLPFIVRGQFQGDSIYRFLLTKSYLAWLIGIVSMIMQVLIYIVFLKAADASQPDNDWEYYYNCPRDNLNCQTSSKLSIWSKGACSFLILLFLSGDFFDGFLIIYEGITISDKRGITAGVSLVFVTLMTLVTSIFYNDAICTSDTELFVNTAVLLFLNDLDEKIHSALKKAFPIWIENIEADIAKKSLILHNRHVSVDIVKKSSSSKKRRSIYDSLKSSVTFSWSVKDIDIENEEEQNPILLLKSTKEKMENLQKELDDIQRTFSKLSSLNFSGYDPNAGVTIGDNDEQEKDPETSSTLRYEGNREVTESQSCRNASLLNPSGSSPDVGVKIDNDYGEEERISQSVLKGTIRQEGTREIMQSHDARNLPLNSLVRNQDVGLKISGNSEEKKRSDISKFLRREGVRDVKKSHIVRSSSIDMFDLNQDLCNESNLALYHSRGARLFPS